MSSRFLLPLCLAAGTLAGCGGGVSLPVDPPPVDPPPVVPTGPVPGVSFNGKVMGNGLPVTGATVQLYEAGTTGNGSASAALLSASLTTDDNGVFIVPASFSCAAASTVLFLVSKGGRVGASSGDNNALWLMAPLGSCGALSATTAVTLNELTTVASAFALGPFLSTGGNVGASSTNVLGLTNAIITAQTLADMSSGMSPGSGISSHVSVASDKIDALADALAPCAASGSCASLFAATTPSASTAPTNTLDAAWNIARYPGANVQSIYALSTGTVFPNLLTAAPSDWTLTITLTGGGMNGPTAIAVDGFGKVWTSSASSLSAFDIGGAPIFAGGITGNGLNESHGIAIDPSNNVWVANNETPGINSQDGAVAEFMNNGQALSGALGYAAGGIYYPAGLAAETDGSMWVANYGSSSVTLLTSMGTAGPGVCNATGCGFSSASTDFPDAIAVDANHFVWVASAPTDYLTRISPDGTQMLPVNCCAGADALAIDAGGYVWAANQRGNSVSLVSNDGAVVSSGYTGGGISNPHGIAVDGAGNVWVTNYQNDSITEMDGSASAAPGAFLSPPTGYGKDAGLGDPYGVAIDASGNVWVSNFSTVPAAGQQGTLTQFVGLAAPVATPLVGPVKLP